LQGLYFFPVKARESAPFLWLLPILNDVEIIQERAVNMLFKPWLPGLLLGMALSAHATVEVRFVAPENFQDASESFADRERTLSLLGAHLRALAAQRVPSTQRLLIEVLDVDLAGHVEPFGRSMERIRVLRPITWPMLELRYVLSEGETMVREGKVRLLDMNYQDAINRYPAGEPLRYEKQLLDGWFASEFAASSTGRQP
jgi:Protein of unknown function (DUF3016)